MVHRRTYAYNFFRNKVSKVGAPTQPICGSIDAKSNLGVKRRQKPSRASRIVACKPEPTTEILQ